MLYLLYMHRTVNMSTGLLSARLGCSQSSKRKIHLRYSPVHTRTFCLQNDRTRDCYLLLSWQHRRNLVQGLEHPRFYVYSGFGHLQFHTLDAALRIGICNWQSAAPPVMTKPNLSNASWEVEDLWAEYNLLISSIEFYWKRDYIINII